MRLFILSLATALVSTVSVAAAAGVELHFTHSITGGTQKEVHDKIVADFEASHPGVKVNQIVYDDDLYSDTGLITQLKSSEPPDIYFQWAGFPMARDADAGFAMDLSEAMAKDGWKESFTPSVWSAGAGTLHDGKPYLV